MEGPWPQCGLGRFTERCRCPVNRTPTPLGESTQAALRPGAFHFTLIPPSPTAHTSPARLPATPRNARSALCSANSFAKGPSPAIVPSSATVHTSEGAPLGAMSLDHPSLTQMPVSPAPVGTL